jgi:voltage-dependent calcium channel alpha-2/delta-4
MTGLRREIAKQVVFTILDTLNDDDFFNIYKFAQDVEPVVPCLNDTLVPVIFRTTLEIS